MCMDYQTHSTAEAATSSSSTHTTYTVSVGCTGNERTLSDCIGSPQSSLTGQRVNFVACREGK